MSVTDALEVLLIEDNPGDARLIEEMLRDAPALRERIDRGSGDATGLKIHHESTLEDGLERLSADRDGGQTVGYGDGNGGAVVESGDEGRAADPDSGIRTEAPDSSVEAGSATPDDAAVDVVLLDLDLPDSAGLNALAAVVERTEFVPVVVLAGSRDEQLGVEAIEEGAQDYLVKDDVESDLLVRTVHHAVERSRQERERVRRRRQLETLNRLNRIAQDVAHLVIDAETRAEIEGAVCERLAAPDAYRFAWIGEVDRGTDRVVPKATAGHEAGYLDEVSVSVDGGQEPAGPGGRAVRSREVQIVEDVLTDPAFEPWREAARGRGYRSVAAVPIVHEDLVYGLLAVYADEAHAFSESEPAILSRFGDFVGHAVAATERKDVLASDSVLEIEFRVEGLLPDLVGLSSARDGAVELRTLVRGDDGLLAYGQADGVDADALRETAQVSDAVDDLRVLSDGETPRFELVTDAFTSLVEAVATHGGRVDSAAVRNGEFRLVVEFPPGGDRRKLVELVEEHYPDATPVAQRTVERPDQAVTDPGSVLEERLTEKQRTALKTAFYAGYFDWPRESTGEEIADRLGVAPPTFTEHLRAAEGKFFATVFESEE